MRKGSKSQRDFRKAELFESVGDLGNPGCGWYHIYTLVAQPEISVPLEQEIWFYGTAPQEKLALALIDLGMFRSGPISDAALSRIDDILRFFHHAGKQVILRFTYDTQGRCAFTEPTALATVKLHMRQTGPLIRDHRRNLLVAQGLYIGNWGEMHGSRFSSGLAVRELAETFFETTEATCFLAVRTPSLIRMLLEATHETSVPKDKLALFNDGMFASSTDLGTYGTADRRIAGEIGKWTREEELRWQQVNLARAPNGGEAAGGDPPVGYKTAAAELQMTHVSYLNSVYQRAQLDHWRKETVRKNGLWNKMNGLDYIGRHLGYRFLVRDVFFGKNRELCVEIENCGFGNLCQKADCFLIFEVEGGRSCLRRLATDPCSWMSGERRIIPTGFSLEEKWKPGSLYISLQLEAGSAPIAFANRHAGTRLKIAELANSKRA